MTVLAITIGAIAGLTVGYVLGRADERWWRRKANDALARECAKLAIEHGSAGIEVYYPEAEGTELAATERWHDA